MTIQEFASAREMLRAEAAGSLKGISFHARRHLDGTREELRTIAEEIISATASYDRRVEKLERQFSGRETSDAGRGTAEIANTSSGTGQPRVGPADRPEYFSGSTIDDLTRIVEASS